MATITTGYESEQNTTQNVAIPVINFSKNFAKQSDQAHDVVFVDINTPVDQPSIVRFSDQDVNNVYAGTTIDPANYSSTRKGRRVLIQNRDTFRNRETATSGLVNTVDLPVKINSTIEWPNNADITPTLIAENTLVRHIGCILTYLGEEGYQINTENLGARLNELMRGALNPIQR